jgi:hypothetical protein
VSRELADSFLVGERLSFPPRFLPLPNRNGDVMRPCFVEVAKSNGCFIAEEGGFATECARALLEWRVFLQKVW